MTPLFFGDADKPLFGMHHEPLSSQFQDTSIVLCNPVGFEYGRSHSVIRYLAKKLAEKGYHVLRFDYYATGESSGHSNEVSVEQSIKDIEIACEEIKSMSATRKVSVVGYRYGALLAAFASLSVKFRRLIMWDPVVDGEEYLKDLQEMHDYMLHDPIRFDLRYTSNTDSSTELLGHDFPENFRDEIKTYRLSELEKIKTKRIDVFSYDGCYSVDQVMSAAGFLVKANVHQFKSQSEWKNAEKIEMKVLPDASIERIIEVIG